MPTGYLTPTQSTVQGAGLSGSTSSFTRAAPTVSGVTSPRSLSPWRTVAAIAFAVLVPGIASAHDFGITDALIVLKNDGGYQVDLVVEEIRQRDR